MTGNAPRLSFDVFGRALNHQFAACIPAARSEIDDPIGRTNNIEIVFNDNDCRAVREQLFENFEKHGYVCGVESDGGFIKHKERIALASAHFTREFETLSFAAGKSGSAFAEREVPETEATVLRSAHA